MGPEPVCPESSYWKVKWMVVEGNRLVLNLIPVRTWVSCPYMRGSQPAYPQPLPASGLGPAVVQLAGAVDYPGPREEARTPRKERRAKDHRAPNHISKTVPPTVHSSPPNWDRTSDQ